MKFYYVYIIQCFDGTFYTGVTNDIDKRINEHNDGYNPESYTFNRRPVVLKWYEKFTSPAEAISFEKQIKGWSRKKKIAIIEGNWNKLPLLSKNYKELGLRQAQTDKRISNIK